MKKLTSFILAVLLGCVCLSSCTETEEDTTVTVSAPEVEKKQEVKELKTINDTFEKIYFLGLTDKNPLEYTSGEDMVFTIMLYGDGKLINAPYFRYEISADDGSKKTGTVEVENGKAKITARCTVPGYARVKVSPCDENKKVISGGNISIFEGGACADFDKITQTKPEPEDFDLFWKSQRELIESVEPTLLEGKKIENAPQGFDVYDVKIQCVEGSRPASGYLTVPQNAKKGSLKLRLLYQGYGVASSEISTKEGYISLHINPHGIENGKDQKYYDDIKANEISGFGFSNNNPPENSYFRNMLLRDVQGLRYLMTEYKDLWNGKDIEIEGGSMGAFQATAVASIMNDVVTRLTINIPWLCDLGSETEGRLDGWKPTYNEGVAYYDTVNFAKRLRAPVTITAGLGDYICPPSGITVLYHSIPSEKKITFIQNKTHSYNPVEKITYVKQG